MRLTTVLSQAQVSPHYIKTKLQIVLLEDSVADAELIAHELERSGFLFALTRVETEAKFLQELRTGPDLILSDHGLPAFSGFKALEIVRETSAQLPFIFVSGSNDQRMVVEMYEQGATDYVFKRDIKDLRTAVLNALEPPPEKIVSPVRPENAPLAAPVFTSNIDHLSYCPQCHRALDGAGRGVLLEDYCGHHNETVVTCQVCAECKHSKK